MRLVIMSVCVIAAMGCGPADFTQPELDAKTAELSSKAIDQYLVGLQKLGELPTDETVSIHFSYYAPTERRANALQAAIARTTPYQARVNRIKEPEEGWSVFGDIPSVKVRSDRWKELLETMVILGLRNRSELRYWAPDHTRSKQLSNNPIKLSVRPVTHLAVASCAPGRPAAYRVR